MVLGLAPLTGPASALLGTLLDSGTLLQFVGVAVATGTLAFPTGFLSAIFVWVWTEDGTVGLLVPAPDTNVVLVVIVVFFSRPAAAVLDAWVPFTLRFGAVPGCLLGGAEGLVFAPPLAAADMMAMGFALSETFGFALSETFGLTLASATASLSSTSWAAGGAAAVSLSSFGDAAGSLSSACMTTPWVEGGSVPTMASVGSVVSMVTPSGFIPS